MGTSFVFLDARKPDCMLKECNLGNVVTDAFVFHYAKQFASESQWTTASVAIQNSGSITSSIFVNAKGTVCFKLTSQGFTPGGGDCYRTVSSIKFRTLKVRKFRLGSLILGQFLSHFGQMYDKYLGDFT